MSDIHEEFLRALYEHLTGKSLSRRPLRASHLARIGMALGAVVRVSLKPKRTPGVRR